MTEQETVQAIIKWLEAEAGERDAAANAREVDAEEAAGSYRIMLNVAQKRLVAAVMRFVKTQIARGEWKAHALGIELAGGSVKVVERKP